VKTIGWIIQFWEIYILINEQNNSVAQLWDGTNLKCMFKRCVDQRLFHMWEEIVEIASTIVFSDREDELIWQFIPRVFILLTHCVHPFYLGD
jgi:hypothetical protein